MPTNPVGQEAGKSLVFLSLLKLALASTASFNFTLLMSVRERRINHLKIGTVSVKCKNDPTAKALESFTAAQKLEAQ